MKKFLKLLINNDRPALVNAGAFTLLAMMLFLVVFAPFVIIALSQNSNALNDATDAVYQHKSELYEILDSVLTYLPFVEIGCFCEIIRRNRFSKKNKVDPIKVAKQLLPVDIACVSALGLDIVIVILLKFV